MAKTWNDYELGYKEKLSFIYPADEIQAIFQLITSDIAQLSSAQYLLKKSESAEAYSEQLDDILIHLQAGKPIQHILGKADFYGSKFEVNNYTLIPRPETEELVHLILQDYKKHPNPKIIDIGTGTGCIPITLHKHLPSSEVWAIDISSEAIEVAMRNNLTHQTKVEFIIADILEWEFIFSEKQYFDVIVSNPPYITPAEKQEMHPNVLDHEPHTALFVEDSTPLIFYDYISDLALHHLQEEGRLYFEINQYLSRETMDLIQKKGFRKVEIIKDINGVDRMICAQR